MHPHSPALRELQEAIRQSLLHRVDGEASAYVMADGLAPGERLGIYRNTAESAMTTVLQLSFPAVQHLVGPEFFEGAARLFASEAPPRSAWLDEYGADFPAFLAGLPQAASLCYLGSLEKTENKARLAGDALSERAWATARRTLRPSGGSV